jgi:hypothetical protein
LKSKLSNLLAMKKNILFFIVVVLLFAGVGFLLLVLLFNKHSFQKRGSYAYATPPPTLPLAKTGPSDANTKPISFPTFHISFSVPRDLKTNKDVDPTSEDTQIGSNFIALYASDTVVDPKKHTQSAGVKLSINVVNTKNDFTSEENIVPTTSIKEATADLSVVPDNNALLNEQNMKVYSFPSDKSASTSSWVYNAEALIKNDGNMIDITFNCVDYSNSKESPVCQKLLKEILPTVGVFGQPRKTVKQTIWH